MSSKLGLAIPSLKSVAESDAFVDGQDPKHTRLFLDAIAFSRLKQQNPREREFVISSSMTNSKCALVLNQQSTAQMADKPQCAMAARRLDSPLRTEESGRRFDGTG